MGYFVFFLVHRVMFKIDENLKNPILALQCTTTSLLLVNPATLQTSRLVRTSEKIVLQLLEIRFVYRAEYVFFVPFLSRLLCMALRILGATL